MKFLGLCFVLLAPLTPSAFAQTVKPEPKGQTNPWGMNMDHDAMQKLLQRYPGWKVEGITRFRDSWKETLDVDCATMRTYRLKRDAPDSDLTFPSSYTTCVPMAKVKIEHALAPDFDPAE